MNDAERRAKELVMKILPRGRRMATSVVELREAIEKAVYPLFCEIEQLDRVNRQLNNEIDRRRRESNGE